MKEKIGLFLSALIGASTPDLLGVKVAVISFWDCFLFDGIKLAIALIAVLIYTNFLQQKIFTDGFKRSNNNRNSGNSSSDSRQ